MMAFRRSMGIWNIATPIFSSPSKMGEAMKLAGASYDGG
jgi:hypothetical protein